MIEVFFDMEVMPTDFYVKNLYELRLTGFCRHPVLVAGMANEQAWQSRCRALGPHLSDARGVECSANGVVVRGYDVCVDVLPLRVTTAARARIEWGTLVSPLLPSPSTVLITLHVKARDFDPQKPVICSSLNP